MITILAALAGEPAKFEGEARTLELNTLAPSGAPEGINFIVPAGGGETFAGDLGAGAVGLRIRVTQPSDTLACTAPVPLGSQAFVKARIRVPEIKPGPGEYNGATVELRTRDSAGKVVSPPGAMFVPVALLRAPSEWTDVEAKVKVPAGAVSGEVCFRFAMSTGTFEVDRLLVIAPKAQIAAAPEVVPPPVAVPPALVAAPAAPSPAAPNPAAPAGRGLVLTVPESGSEVACTAWFPAMGRIEVFGSLVVTRSGSAVDWSGIAVEGFVRGAGGKGIGRVPYVPLRARVEPGTDAFTEPWKLPAGTTEARLCLRTSSAAASGIVDWRLD